MTRSIAYFPVSYTHLDVYKRQVLAKRLELLRLQMAQLGHLRSKCLRQSTYRQRLLLPIAARRAGRLLSSEGHLLPQFPFKPLESALQLSLIHI